MHPVWLCLSWSSSWISSVFPCTHCLPLLNLWPKEKLKISKGWSEVVNTRTNTSTTEKTNDQHEHHYNQGVMCSAWVSSSCSTSGIRRVSIFACVFPVLQMTYQQEWPQLCNSQIVKVGIKYNLSTHRWTYLN
jgi:hypothetical protein